MCVTLRKPEHTNTRVSFLMFFPGTGIWPITSQFSFFERWAKRCSWKLSKGALYWWVSENKEHGQKQLSLPNQCTSEWKIWEVNHHVYNSVKQKALNYSVKRHRFRSNDPVSNPGTAELTSKSQSLWTYFLIKKIGIILYLLQVLHHIMRIKQYNL